MRKWKMAALGLLAAPLLPGGEAAAGWAIEQAVKGGAGEGVRQQIVVQSNRLKAVSLGPDGRPVQAMILDLSNDTLTQVNYPERTYVTATVQEYVQTISHMTQAAAGQRAEAMKAMQQQLQNLSPEQRKQVEAMMRQAPAGGGTAPCAERKREIRRTGQQATVAGYPAIRYEVLADGQLEAELWMAPGLTLARELDLRKLEQFSTAMARVGPGCGPGQSGPPGTDLGWKLAAEGYPVRTVQKEPGITVEVVQAESRALPAAEFQPPAGFARRTLRELMGQ
jgi:hypothetical protein